MGITYYQLGTGFAAVTNQSPKGLADVLFVGRAGQTLASVSEQVFSPGQFKGQKPVAKADLDDAWVLALGYEQPEPIEEEYPIFDHKGEELLALVPIRRQRRVEQPEQPVTSDLWKYLGWAVGVALVIYFWNS